jgi:squalene-associated FAD-dependent desaturase
VTTRVVVVGGGLAGVAAALAAADGGADVVLVERRTRLGGLVSSFRHGGLSFDNGQHVFLRCCIQYRGFLDRIGAADLVHLQPRLDVPVLAPGGRSSSLWRAPLPAPFHLGPSLLGYRHLSPRERVAAARAALALRRLDPDDAALDERNFGSWLSQHGQSPQAVDHLWQLIARPTLNLSVDEASLAAATKVFRTGLLDHAAAADIGWARQPLGLIHDDHAAKALAAANVEVLAGTGVDRIESSDELTVVAGDRRHTGDAVVLAVPHDVAAGLLPAGALRPGVDPARLGTSPVVDVHLVLDRRVTEHDFAAVVDSPVQFVFDRTASAGATNGQVLAVSLSAADAHLGTRPEALVAAMVEALEELFPAIRQANVRDGLVTKERSATFRAVPGARAHRAGAATRIPGLFLAGSWTDTGWPATMEGAVRSGTTAAALAVGSGSWTSERPSGHPGVQVREGRTL